MSVATLPIAEPSRRLVDSPIRAVMRLFLRLALAGRLAVVEDGTTARLLGDPSKAEATVTVHDPAVYRQLARRRSVGLGLSYVAGWWDADDLVALCRLATRRLPAPGSALERLLGLAGRLGGDRSRGSVVDRLQDREDVRAHYDLGDDVFALFLDPTLTYSCAVFDEVGMTLEEAQIAKLDRICRKLELVPGDEVLEIGTGWGSFAIHAASRYGCRVTTTTLSERQYEFSRRLVSESGLSHLVTVLQADYRELTGTFDKIGSIEMIEAVGWRQHDWFFEVCADRLRPGGLMALQAIVIDDGLYERAKRADDFIKAMVFPGSTIPSVAAISSSLRRASDFYVVDTEDIGRHYATTLERWRRRFLDNRAEVAALGYDEGFLRLWDLYLAYCQAGFAEGRISDVQMLLARPPCRHSPVPGRP